MHFALYAGTIFTSAFLLFLIQPIASKHILPWFGGSAAVWAVSLSFFQVLLLAGYAYADWTTRRLSPRVQVLLHIALLVLAFITLQVLADPSWKPAGQEDPTLRILLMLGASIGLPYFLLSSTGPLVQGWVARSAVDVRVYRLFSLSNLASLLGLLAYPFLIEPLASLGQQALAWSAFYGLFTLLCAAAGWRFLAQTGQTGQQASACASPPPAPAPGWAQNLRWLALSALASWLLVATTNHLTRDVASVPFLWIVPLVLYLLSFVLCFESDRWYRSHWMQALLVLIATILCAVLVPFGPMIALRPKFGSGMAWLVAAFSLGLFLQCMFLHGELALRRPAGAHLTRFYLMMSVGGAAGGLVVSLVAPRVLPGYYEFGFAQVLVGVLALGVLRRRELIRVAALATALACAMLLGLKISSDIKTARTLQRNFYGTLATFDRDTAAPDKAWRQLAHGTIVHGAQFLAPQRQREATTYYIPSAGLGRAIEATRRSGQHIGVIGLGAGTTAVYGRPGDRHRFYEINPQVIDLAQREFSFLRNAQAQTELVLGDARLMLEREAPQGFDVLAVDAFSGDSVPTHLLTREAMAVYLRHMRTGGVIAFHVSNTHLSLAPVVNAVARDAGLAAVQVQVAGNDKDITRSASDWVLVARNAAVLQHAAIGPAAQPIVTQPGLRVWTDDHNDLLSVLK
ncbi:MAG: fused MFS/spermidine synthase [Pseudomonadota bacterium]